MVALFFGNFMADTNTINVVAISLATKQPVMLMGSLTKNALHIIELTQLPASIPKLRESIAKLRTRLAKAGRDVTIYTEDPTGLLRDCGYQLRLDSVAPADSRPLVSIALERYRALTSVNGIQYPGGDNSAYRISDSVINIKLNDMGKTVYEVDWASIKDGTRVMMLLIYGAMCQGPMQADYLRRMFAAMDEGSSKPKAGNGFLAVTVGYDRLQQSKFPAAAQSGETL